MIKDIFLDVFDKSQTEIFEKQCLSGFVSVVLQLNGLKLTQLACLCVCL